MPAVSDPTHKVAVNDLEYRLHQHLEYHRNGEYENGLVQTAGRIIVWKTSERLRDRFEDRSIRSGLGHGSV